MVADFPDENDADDVNIHEEINNDDNIRAKNNDLAAQPLDNVPWGQDVAQQALPYNQDEQDSDEEHQDEENVENAQPEGEPVDNEQPFEQQPNGNELQRQPLQNNAMVQPYELADNEPDNVGRVQPRDQDE